MNKTFILLLFAVLLIGSVSASFEVAQPFALGSSITSSSAIGSGQQIKMNANYTLVNVTKTAGTDADRAYLLSSANVVIANASFIGNLAIFDDNARMLAGTAYKVVVNKTTGNFNINYNNAGATYPQSNTYFNWTNSVDTTGADAPTYAFAVTSVGIDTFIPDAPISVNTTLNSPSNNTNHISNSITFNSTTTITNGNITNATLYLWNTTGIFNQTTLYPFGQFNGVNSWITQPSYLFNTSNENPFTLCTWYNRMDNKNNPMEIMNGWTGSKGTSVKLRFAIGADNYTSLAIYNNTAAATVTIQNKINRNEWNFVCAGYNGSISTIQSNNYPMSFGQKELAGTAYALNFSIGDDIGSNIYFNGSISNVAIFNRSLSSTEITTLYNSGRKPINPITDGLVASYYLQGDTLDSSGNGNNGVNTNVNFSLYSVSDLTTSQMALFNVSNFNLGTYYWNVLGCGTNSSSTGCSFALTNNTFSYGWQNNPYNSTATEGIRESFSINVSSSVTSAKLNYKGTNYTASILSGVANTSLIVPLGVGTNNIYWILNDNFNTSTQSQTVNPFIFGNCNSTLTIPYLNWTFLDEATSTRINGSIDSSSFTYWLDSQSINKTYTYSNSSTNNKNYDFCFNPNNTAVNMLYNVKYSFTGYPQRTLTFGTLSYTNNTKNQTLYLLSSTVGLYVTFQIINTAQQPIEGALVDISRPDLGVNISSSYTDASGGATFWMNPNFAHTVVVTAAGYPVYTTSITPTQSVYTITLGSVSNTSITDYGQGISYNVTPIGFELTNNTIYPFNFTISSSYWQMSSVGFYVTNGSTTLCTQSTTNVNYAALTCNLNTGKNTTFVMNYYYIVNGSTQNLTKTWVITDYEGSSYSIWYFFTHLSTYLNQGIFGLTKFGLSLIVFFIIFTFAGVLSYKYGLTSPAAIMGIIFALTALFDVGLGLIPSPMPNALPHFVTMLVGLILISILIREGNY